MLRMCIYTDITDMMKPQNCAWKSPDAKADLLQHVKNVNFAILDMRKAEDDIADAEVMGW